MSWPLATIGECCEIVSGSTPKTHVKENWDGDIPWVTPKDLSDLKSAYIETTTRTISPAGLSSCSTTILPAGSILFSSRAPIGLVAINKIPMCTNQGFKNLIPDSNKLHNKYLFHWLKANRESLEDLGNGATFKELSKTVIARVKIPLPPLEEQRRIAEILDKVDALREKRRQSIAMLDTLVQSVFLEMFGDPVTNPRHFDTAKLGKVCDVRDGTHDSPKYIDFGFPLITSKNLSQGIIDLSNVSYISMEDFTQINKRSKVDKGDLLMPMIGTIGNPVIVEEEPNFAIKNIALIKFPTGSPSNIYIKELLCSRFFKYITAKRNRGGTQKFLALGDIRNIVIPIPPQQLQDEFAFKIEKIKRLGKVLNQSLINFDLLFCSLQADLFDNV